MNLFEVEIGKEYTISNMCEFTTLFEKGVIPGEKVVVSKRQGGLVLFDIVGAGSFAIRYEEAKCIKV